jgi:hypothetical protein
MAVDCRQILGDLLLALGPFTATTFCNQPLHPATPPSLCGAAS